LLLLALAIAQPRSVSAGMEEGSAAYKQGHYAAALRELRPLAEQGNAKAQTYLENMYTKGRGVPQSDTEALKWYGKSAEQGEADAQFHLGIIYNIGQGVPRNIALALRWYRKAAEQGHAVAQSGLAIMYNNDVSSFGSCRANPPSPEF